MPSTLFRWALFLSSYFPLFAILAIRNWECNRVVAYITLGLAGAGAVAVLAFIGYAGRAAPFDATINSVVPRSGEATAYIATYVIPFLDVDLSVTTDQVSMILLLLVVGTMYVNSSLIHLNPLLNLRWQVYEVTTSAGGV